MMLSFPLTVTALLSVGVFLSIQTPHPLQQHGRPVMWVCIEGEKGRRGEFVFTPGITADLVQSSITFCIRTLSSLPPSVSWIVEIWIVVHAYY